MAEVSAAAINSLMRSINNLASQQAAMSSHVDNLGASQRETRGEVARLAAMVSEFIDRNLREMAVNTAETRVGNILQELETTFGHYEAARQSGTGLLQAFDSGLVSEASVRSISEELMILTPRYWLSPALVALAAWSRNEQNLAHKALSECLRRDVDKTALFFMLVMRRYRREHAACQWLEQFLLSQDPAALGREFVVVLEAMSNGAFGPSVSGIIDRTIARWLDELGERPGFAEEQVSRWVEEMNRLVKAESADKFPSLSSWSPAWESISRNLGMVKTHVRIRHHFQAIFEGEVTLSPDLEVRIDDLLDNLVTSFDTEELPLRRELAKQQAIIDSAGDENAAAARASTQMSALEEKISFPNLLTNAAMHPKETDVDKGTQRLATALCRDWIVAAHERFTANARRDVLVDIPLKHGTWQSKIRSASDQGRLINDINHHIDAETSAEVAGIRFTGVPLVVATIAGVLLIVGLATLTVAVIVIAVLGGIYSGYQYLQIGKRKQMARDQGERRKVIADIGVKDACAEFVDLRKAWQVGDDAATPLHDELLAMKPADFGVTGPGARAMVVL